MRAHYTDRTRAILGVLAKGPRDAEAVAQGAGCSVSTARVLLLRLASYGQVSREKTQDGEVSIDASAGLVRPRFVYLYTITPRGLGRLRFLAERAIGR